MTSWWKRTCVFVQKWKYKLVFSGYDLLLWKRTTRVIFSFSFMGGGWTDPKVDFCVLLVGCEMSSSYVMRQIPVSYVNPFPCLRNRRPHGEWVDVPETTRCATEIVFEPFPGRKWTKIPTGQPISMRVHFHWTVINHKYISHRAYRISYYCPMHPS